MINSLLKNCLITKCGSYAAASQTDVTGTIVDLSSPTEGSYDSVMFIASLGTVTSGAVDTLKAYCGNNSALSDGAYATTTATVTASGTDTNENFLILDVVRPGKRYVRPDVILDTQNTVFEALIAIRYNAKNAPVTQTAAVASGAISVNMG